MISNFSIALLFFAFSCSFPSEKDIELTILNDTKFNIDSVRVNSYGTKLLFVKLAPKQSISKKIKIRYDGKYEGAFSILIYKQDSLKNSGTFGYFSTIDDVKPSYRVTIFDSFKFKEN